MPLEPDVWKAKLQVTQ